jgi:3'(2'), 5'-bisphosphate nucleotidase
MDMKARNELALAFGSIVSEAGLLINAIRGSNPGARRKPDGSPVCRADIEAEALILERLASVMPGVTIIAEESFAVVEEVPRRFLLVDPIDGTREFLAGYDDFTVNIALIEAGEPIAGAICVPARREVYVGGAAAFAAALAVDGALPSSALQPIATRATPDTGLIALTSRSHADQETERWLLRPGVAAVERAGSSLKFCLVARGEADVYPRLAPTMEWDTAAGHAILTAAGGAVLALDGAPLRYGKRDLGFKNAGFIAWGVKPAP